MYIKKLILQHFGKYHNREMELQKGINLIYGPNEAGKTTVRDFIIGMFYGIERSRGVAARTDEYTRREPLEGGGYSGSMELYKDGVRYRVDRSFRKDQKYLKVYQQESGRELEIGDRLSLQGILTDLDKNGYTNTLCISSQGAAYKQELQEEFRHYLMNVKETHTGNLNLKDAYACLQEQRKALNRKGLENELQSVSHRMEELSLETELERIGKERQACEKRLLALSGQQEQEQADSGKDDAERADRGKKDRREQMDPQLKQIITFLKVLLGFGVLALVLILIFILPITLYYKGWLTVIAVVVALYLWCMSQYKRRKKERANQKETDKSKENAPNGQDERVSVSADQIMEYSQRLADLQVQENELLKRNAQQQELKSRYDDIKSRLAYVDRELAAIDLAQSTIQSLSGDIYDQYAPALSRQVSDMVARITQGRYTDVRLDEQLQIQVRKGDRYLGAEYLSAGTLEQIYLAVRLAVAQEMGQSGMPLILDDIFGAYDDARLEECLQCLACYPAEQIIIFTAGDRLADTLDHTDIDYNYIEV